jgi:hypothetical protein
MLSVWKRGSLRVSLMPQPPWRSMKAGAQDAGDAVHAHDAPIPCASASFRPHGARDGHGEDGQQRQTLYPSPPAITSPLR